MLSIPSTSREYVRASVTAEGQDADLLSTLDVNFAFLSSRTGEPTDSDLVEGSWEPGRFPAQARCLVGPGGTKVLTNGIYYVWVQVVSSPEQPMRMVGTLKIT